MGQPIGKDAVWSAWWAVCVQAARRRRERNRTPLVDDLRSRSLVDLVGPGATGGEKSIKSGQINITGEGESGGEKPLGSPTAAG